MPTVDEDDDDDDDVIHVCYQLIRLSANKITGLHTFCAIAVPLPTKTQFLLH